MAKTKKGTDGVFWKRGEGHKLVFYWQIGKRKSKIFSDQIACAQEYIARYVEENPKYQELVYDKTWDQLFAMFGVTMVANR